MVLIHPVRDSGTAGHFPQLAQVKVEVANAPGQGKMIVHEAASLTHGAFDVTKLLQWDEENHAV